MDVDDLLNDLVSKINDMAARLSDLETAEYTHWKGLQSGDFSTTTLPNPGDYGYQTTDNEVQFNIGGSIRAVSTSAP